MVQCTWWSAQACNSGASVSKAGAAGHLVSFKPVLEPSCSSFTLSSRRCSAFLPMACQQVLYSLTKAERTCPRRAQLPGVLRVNCQDGA